MKRTKRRPTAFIAAWRDYRNIGSQSELARLSGVSRSVISRLEGGQVVYREDLLVPLAKALDCQPFQLIEGDPATKDIRALYTLVVFNSPGGQDWIRRFQAAS